MSTMGLGIGEMRLEVDANRASSQETALLGMGGSEAACPEAFSLRRSRNKSSEAPVRRPFSSKVEELLRNRNRRNGQETSEGRQRTTIGPSRQV